MDFQAQVDDLEKHVADLKTSVAAAAKENHQQLTQRIDKAQADADHALDHAKQQAGDAADTAKSQWEQARADAKARAAKVKAKAQHRADKIDADFAAGDANVAEADAYDAIDFADWAVENARLAILDAIDARVYADERAAALV
jgi:hypothetical protein